MLRVHEYIVYTASLDMTIRPEPLNHGIFPNSLFWFVIFSEASCRFLIMKFDCLIYHYSFVFDRYHDYSTTEKTEKLICGSKNAVAYVTYIFWFS
jgi:hypothetical protein